MKINTHLLSTICWCLFFLPGIVTAQDHSTSQPQVTEKLDVLFQKENFDSISPYWNIISNAENLILVQDGQYLLHRKATFSPYAVMSSQKQSLTAFKLVTSLQLQKTVNEDGSIGVIFMAQEGGTGGFIFEINGQQQYRLRQIVNGTYKFIGGDAKTNGWVKSAYVKEITVSNMLDIRYFNKHYDLYLNGAYLMSFTELTYRSGQFGYLIGPGSKGAVDFMYLFTNEVNSAPLETKDSVEAGDADVKNLAESIISLKTQINKLQETNADLKFRLEGLDAAEKDCQNQRKQQDKLIKSMQNDLSKSQHAYDSLLKVNAELNRYKELVSGNDGGDLVISLSKNLKAEKIKNEQLTKNNSALRDSLLQLKAVNKTLKIVPATTTGTKTKSTPEKEKDQEPKEFTLPKE